MAALRAEPFAVIAPKLPNGMASTMHLALSDPSGDSAIFQYVGGTLTIHHGRQFQVMTNSPVYDQQLALNAYWEQIGGVTMLPGTNRAADRFVRASFYIKAIPQTADVSQALAGAMSVLRNCSVPIGITTPGQPNISSTIWRVASDQKNKVYYFDSPFSMTSFAVPLASLDFKPGAPVKKLPMAQGQTYSGNAAERFVVAAPFAFLGIEAPAAH